MTNHPAAFLHRQIPVIILLSIFPGLGYVFLSSLHGSQTPALIWYAGILLISGWGSRLYKAFAPAQMSQQRLDRWYRQLTVFYYLFFLLWATIFLIYIREEAGNLHYIAIFTQIGTMTVASALLYPEPRLFRPLIPLMAAPLVIYFALLGQWYGYVLSLFSAILGWVLYYAASSSYLLLRRTQHQANHDSLTGLYNRHAFMMQLRLRMNSLTDNHTHSFLMLVDLDHFKTINDSLGHEVGDDLLQEIARRLLHLLPEQALLARLGGDEFVIIGGEFDDIDYCRERALGLSGRLLNDLKATHVINGHHLYVSASIGVRMIQPGSTDPGSLVKEADIAMYEAKAGGRDGTSLFDAEMAARVEAHLQIERSLHLALNRQELALHYQPQHDADGRLIGAECLARWHSPTLGEVPPADFITIAEQTGLIIELGQQILVMAVQTLRDWWENGLQLQQFSINISVRQLTHQGFIEGVEMLCERYLDAGARRSLVFEVTETVAAEEIDRVVSAMNALKTLGIRFSMDDFGTGYSSLSALKKLPISELKIDQSFVRNLEDEDDQAMVITILSIAGYLGLTIVAEGVETEHQLGFLRDYRCRIFQGYLFSPPLQKADFEQYAATWQHTQ